MKENLSTMRKPKINKAYVLLKELIKSSNDKNVDIFYLKYINLIEELEIFKNNAKTLIFALSCGTIEKE